jgi:hypothetical protein
VETESKGLASATGWATALAKNGALASGLKKALA